MTLPGGYVVSDSGVIVYKTPRDHPLLKDTNTAHPDFRRKLREVYSRGKVNGMPRICSSNSEDAVTWHYWSPPIADMEKKTEALTRLLGETFGEVLPAQVLEAIPSADLQFWQPLSPPSSRPVREGPSEPDVMVRLGRQAVVLVEAKYRSRVSEYTTYDAKRDQLIRLIDVGSWYARQARINRTFVIVLQYGAHETNAEQVVRRYANKPEAIRQALNYRSDLTREDYVKLSRSVAFVRWPDPLL